MEETTITPEENNDNVVVQLVEYPSVKDQVISYGLAIAATAATIGVVAGGSWVVDKVSTIKYNRRIAKLKKAEEATPEAKPGTVI